MGTDWALQEGTLAVGPGEFTTNEGAPPPVVHVDSDAPLYDDHTGDLITGQMWGIYYKPDFYFGGVQGGTSPYVVAGPAAEVAVDPYGPESPEYTVTEDFARMWTSALAHCQGRVQPQRPPYPPEAPGGGGAVPPGRLPGL